MLMKKIKFKILILLIFVLGTSQYSLDIFADTPSERITVTKNNSTILDGEIGEWDPDIVDKPDFENNKDVDEIEGNKPQQGDYYTISVTVPINMEFYVLPNSHLGFGSFYSPTYTIKNNGSKNISVKLSSFNIEKGLEDDKTTPLYVEKIDSTDHKTQIELKMCSIDDLDTWWKLSKEIDLTSLDKLQDSELYTLTANEKKGVTFNAEKWELPQIVSGKEKAVSNFTACFTFSVSP